MLTLNKYVNPHVIFGLLILVFYHILTMGKVHMLPNYKQIYIGFYELVTQKELLYHFFKSIFLFFKGITCSVIISLAIVYVSPYKWLKPMSSFVSKCRYLPLVGFTYYASLIFESARSVQIFMLTFFISTFFITGLLSMIEDITDEEWEHAKSLGLTKWEQIKELIIFGRIDYVVDILRQNLAISWMMIAAVEMIMFGNGGLGTLLKTAYKWDGQGKIVALQLIILVIGITLDWFLNKVRKTFWRFTF